MSYAHSLSLIFIRDWFVNLHSGGGVTPATNQRIHLAQTCYDWSRRPELNGEKTNGELLMLAGAVQTLHCM